MQKIKVICGYLKKICVVKKISFSLVESAVVLAVAGSVIGGGLTAYKSTNPKVKSDLKKMEAIEKSLQQFFTTNGRLPFPAHPTQGPSTANYLVEYKSTAYNATQEHYVNDSGAMTAGGTDQAKCIFTNPSSCNPGDFVLWGVVPTRTLGLPDDYAYDSYGHNFEYVMHSAAGVSNEALFQSSTYKKSNYTSNASGQYTVLYPHVSNTSAKKQVLLTRLSVYNNSTAKQIPTTVNNTAYVLISKGDTGKCYFNAKGSLNTTKPTGNLLKNCVQNYGNNSTTERTIYQGYSKSFNNVVRYKTMTELISTASSIQEDTRNLGKGTVRSQQRVDSSLQTSSKEVVGAINELVGATNELKAENAALKARLDAMQSSNDTSNKLFLTGATSQAAQPTTRSNSNVYMQNGTLYLTKPTDAEGSTNNKPALIVGGTDAQGHLELDSNEIMAKASGTTTGALYINANGGDVSIAASGNTYVGSSITNSNLYIGKSGGTSKIYVNGTELKTSASLTKQDICEMMYPVGSIYMNYSKTDNPKDLLGCGTWYSISANYYLMAANPAKNNSEYNAYDNYSGNYAGSYLMECLPNIQGTIIMPPCWLDGSECVGDTGSHTGTNDFFYKDMFSAGAIRYVADINNNGGGFYNGNVPYSDNFITQFIYKWFKYRISASWSSHIYRNNCTAVRPKSYVVYIWRRGA